MSTTATTNNWNTLSDEVLMAMLTDGKHEALIPLYQRYAALVFNMTAQTLDRPAAEEIVQDVFVAVWSKAKTFDPSRGTVRPWLLQIAHTRVLNELRRRSRRPKEHSDPDGETVLLLPDQQPTPDEEVWDAVRRDAVQEAVAELPPLQREALRLAYFDELSHAQVAEYLGLPLGTAKTRIRDGMKRLRLSLAAVAITCLALIVGGVAALRSYQRQQDRLELNQDALGMVTSSDVVEHDLSPATGEPADAHGNYRDRPGGGIAILTVSALPPLTDGERYVAWIDTGNGWESLGTIGVDSSGHALLIIDRDDPSLPVAVQVTRETQDNPAVPSPETVISWRQ
jgi:RNA polymerase sigma-70 factor (ECF subfamily)